MPVARVVALLLALAFVTTAGCGRGGKAVAAAEVVGEVEGVVEVARQAPAASPTAAPSDLKWPSSIAWQSWEQGVEQSRASGKPILLVVYADWCARCKELAPAFDDPRMQALKSKAIMVRQNQDTAPGWLTEQFGAYGSYVPRVFFVEPDGIVRADLVSGHPRFPYFYAPVALDPLIANLRQITGG